MGINIGPSDLGGSRHLGIWMLQVIQTLENCERF